jgi:hypothetical protein
VIEKPVFVECWGRFELSQLVRTDGNPFLDVTFSATFTPEKGKSITVDGFYDGDGIYQVRFMPEQLGQWHYETHSNLPTLNGLKGSFTCVTASAGNHGPVRVAHTHHFAYANGTRHFSVGTTCYAWIHQSQALQLQTLETLRTAPFNKLRMCVFPKFYEYNQVEPALYPFEKDESGKWDFARFNPAFFRHLETRIDDLQKIGIEADLILFHPYDNGRWGFDRMGVEADDRYVRYIVARLSAFRNVWWSMANEWDLCSFKTLDDWDRFFQIVHQSDSYQHLRSIHNWHEQYDHKKPWVTHASIQTLVAYPDLEKVADWREAYQKPVVVDETCYEGNIPFRWGFLTPQEMVHRFWLGTVLGGYVGHGETYLHPEDVLWWSKGGVLHGESPGRIAFLRGLLEETSPEGLRPTTEITRDLQCAGQPNTYYLAYGGRGQPAEARFNLPEGVTYRAEIIDAWEMTVTPLAETLTGRCQIRLPGKPYIGVRLKQL